MAIVSFVKCKRTQTVGGLKGVIDYCCKESKTDCKGRALVSGINCVPKVALQEFMNTKHQHGSTGGRMYYHMIQSFHPDDPVTPELSHEIALKLAEEIPGFEIVVATHTDRDHIHSHFVINSVSCDSGKKYHSNKESLMKLREASDRLCLEYGLSVVKPKPKKQEHTMSAREYRAYDKGQSWKMNLEISIDDCMAAARDREHFLKLMEWNGYGVKWTADRKYITYTTPEGNRCRDIKLNGTKYHKEVMEHEFRIRQKIACRYACSAEGNDQQSGSGASDGGRDGTELESDDCFAKRAGKNSGRDSGDAGYSDHGQAAGGIHESAAGSPAGGRTDQCGNHGAVPADSGDGSGEYNFSAERSGDRASETGWEHERGIWESTLAGAGSDEAYFEDAAAPGYDTKFDPAAVGMDAAYLVGHLSNVIGDKPVQDCTAKHFRPERKKNHGHAMGM